MESNSLPNLPPTPDSYRELLRLVTTILKPLDGIITTATIARPNNLNSFFAKGLVDSLRNEEFLNTFTNNTPVVSVSVEFPYSYLNQEKVNQEKDKTTVRELVAKKLKLDIPESKDPNSTYRCRLNLYDIADPAQIDQIQALARASSNTLKTLVQNVKAQESARDLETAAEYAGYQVGEPFTQSALHRRESTMAHEGKTYGTESEDALANGSIVAVLDGVGSGGKHSGILARAIAEGLESMETNFADIESAREAITDKIIAIRKQYYETYKDDKPQYRNSIILCN
ncbi:MAG: hypothetical protein WCK98_03360 [bacterium]